MREVNASLSESVEEYLKGFDTSLNILQIESNNICVDISVEATMQILNDVGSFDRFHVKDEIFNDYFSFTKNRRRRRRY